MCFDEADQLFEDGNLKDQIDTIIRKSRIPSRCQYLGLSATFTESLKERLMILMNEYIYLNTDDFDQNGNENTKVSNELEGVLQYAITLASCAKPRQTLQQKIEVAAQIIKFCPYTQCMMFCSNRRRAETAIKYFRMQKVENNSDMVIQMLCGTMMQSERQEALMNLRSGYAKITVATDLAARGIAKCEKCPKH